ncbi:MAG: flavodoxin domain-containing protein [Bacteroidales bacterium]|nr:flavodoxin domain-containing protein [Bacteroidales bacterium]
MKKIAILYWGKGGNVEKAAKVIFNQFDPQTTDLFALDSINTNSLTGYKLVILGGSTVGAENWEETTNDNRWNHFFREIENKDFSGVTFAVFGLGNQVLYPANFVDALGIFHEAISKTGARIIGAWPTVGYKFTDSDGLQKDSFYGLALDEDTQPDLTLERSKQWTDILKKEMKF